jgi:hypothetical protein
MVVPCPASFRRALQETSVGGGPLPFWWNFAVIARETLDY